GSEGFESRSHEHRADLALVQAAFDELLVHPDRGEGTTAARAELEVVLGRHLAPRAPRDLDAVVGLEPGVRERIDVALAVVPLDVLLLADLERGLVHLGLAGLEHVLEVLEQQVPLVIVVLLASFAGDHDALDALALERPTHPLEVLEVRADVLRLLGFQPEGLAFVIAERLFHHTGSVTSTSSSRRPNVLNPSPASNPPSSPRPRARSPTQWRGWAVPCDSCARSDSSLVSSVFEIST